MSNNIVFRIINLLFYSFMNENYMEKGRSRGSLDCIPDWLRDNLVLRLFDNCGFRVEVLYDYKYRNGICDKPLIMIKRKRECKRYK